MEVVVVVWCHRLNEEILIILDLVLLPVAAVFERLPVMLFLAPLTAILESLSEHGIIKDARAIKLLLTLEARLACPIDVFVLSISHLLEGQTRNFSLGLNSLILFLQNLPST